MKTVKHQPSTVSRTALELRRKLLLHWASEANAPHFNPEGEWISPTETPGIRERQWHCLNFYEGGPEHVALANRILETSVDDGNDFTAFYAPLLLRLHADKMTPRARILLETSFDAVLPHAYDHLFRYTENCGLMNAFGLFEAAALKGRTEYRAKAIKYLEMFEHFLQENGVAREYFSINYLPVTLFAAGTLRWLTRDREVRSLARRIEHHLWMELALCWHPELHHPASASGRSYTVNSMGGYSGIHSMAWLGFGDEVCPSPERLGIFTSGEACASQETVVPFLQAHCGIYASVLYNPPAKALRLALEKSFPFNFQVTTTLASYRAYDRHLDISEAEAQRIGGWFARGGANATGGVSGTAFLPSTITFPRGRTHLFGHMDRDFGLGTATQQMTSQSDTCFAVWRRKPQVKDLSGFRTLYLRYTLNNALEECFDQPEYGGNLAEQGRGGAIQSGPLAIAWYAGGEEITTGISKMRTCVMVSEWFGPVEEVWLGDQKCPDRVGASDKPDWVFLRDGTSFVGIRPLVSLLHGGGPLVAVRPIGRFLCLSFANYDGTARDFQPALLRQTGGGAAICLGSAEQFRGGFEAFRKSCLAAVIEDETYECHRRLRAEWNGREVEVLSDLQTENLVFARTESGFVKERRLSYAK
jgi:hypothetical protein